MHLKEVRVERKLSQGALAREAGISRVTVHRIEHGQQTPHMSTVLKIARALDVEPSEIFPDLFAVTEDPSQGVELTNEIYKRFFPYVRTLARRIARNTGDTDELEGAGFEGLWEACRKWRPDGGMKFDPYAKNYVRNRILDEKDRLYKGETYGLDSLPARFEGEVPDMATWGDDEE